MLRARRLLCASMDSHPVKASPPAGWLLYTNDFWRAIFPIFSCQKTCGRGPGARPEVEDAMDDGRFSSRWSQSNSITRQHAWEGGFYDTTGFSDRLNFARWEQRMRNCSEKPCLRKKRHAMPCQRGETTACSRGAKPGPCHTHSQRKWQAGCARQFSQPSHAFRDKDRMRTWKRWQGGRLEGGLDWTGGGQWDESKPPRSVRLCLAFGMIQWDQGSECDGRACGMIGAGCVRSEAIKSDARMLVDGLGITNTLPRRYSARLPPPRSHYARLALVRHGPCKEAGLSSILPYLWSACRGAHRGGPSPSAEPPS